MGVISVYILNRFGGLIYFKQTENADNIEGNQHLKYASAIHSMNELCKNLFKKRVFLTDYERNKAVGFKQIETDEYSIHIKTFLTGLQIFIVSANTFQSVDTFIDGIYEYYTKKVTTDIDYNFDMPINLAHFDEFVEKKMKGSDHHFLTNKFLKGKN